MEFDGGDNCSGYRQFHIQNEWPSTPGGGNTRFMNATPKVLADVDPKRSANMAKIGPRNTVPELAVRRALHRMGFRFRLHRSELPGRPDVVLPRHRTIFLIHGCFWHRHVGCRFAYLPKTRVEFWTRKFQRNVHRDGIVERELERLGWKVAVIWECETRDPQKLDQRLRGVLGLPEKRG